jgi:diacylglycerol kinase (ATP)
MFSFLKSRIPAFKNAFSGLWYVIKTQKNAWIHLIATISAVALGFWLKLDKLEWAIIIFSIAFVWSAEVFNTSIETGFDILIDEPHPMVKIGKDVGAAAVLISSTAALIIGLLIFLPKILELI